MRNQQALHVLRVGLGITFLWVGVLIFRDPQFWSGFIQPWVAALVATIHLTIVLITVGIDVVTVRDIGLLAGTLALVWAKLPKRQQK